MKQKKSAVTPSRSRRGGVRPGAGRPPGTSNKITVQGLLDEIRQRSGGQDYTELLVEDFLEARLNQDRQLAHKYHTLISGKVLAERLDIEVNDTGEMVQARREAFAAALAAVAGIDPIGK